MHAHPIHISRDRPIWALPIDISDYEVLEPIHGCLKPALFLNAGSGIRLLKGLLEPILSR